MDDGSGWVHGNILLFSNIRSSSGLLMALGKILLGRWTADIYLEDCLMIRSTGVDNEDCA